MGKYMVYGYLLDKRWLVCEGVKREMGTNENMTERDNTFIKMVYWTTVQAGVHRGRSKLMHVRVKVEGKIEVWPCLAIATNDPCDDLPKSRADGLNLERLKELLQTDRPPRWYQYN